MCTLQPVGMRGTEITSPWEITTWKLSIRSFSPMLRPGIDKVYSWNDSAADSGAGTVSRKSDTVRRAKGHPINPLKLNFMCLYTLS